jgi:hypothetical protein
MTYEELKKLCLEGTDDADPLSGSPDGITETPEGLFLTCDSETPELLIKIDGDQLVGRYRDHPDVPETIYGKEWSPEKHFNNFGSLSCWAYCL